MSDHYETDASSQKTTLTPDEIDRLLTSTEPDAEERLRERARDIAAFATSIAREHDRTDTRLTTLARLVVAGDTEAATMAEYIARGGKGDEDADPIAFDEITIKRDRVSLSSCGWMANMIAVGALKILDSSGFAINYVEMRFATPAWAAEGRSEVLLTAQRLERPTPHELRRAAEDREGVAKMETVRLREGIEGAVNAIERRATACRLLGGRTENGARSVHARAVAKAVEADDGDLLVALRAVIDTLRKCDLDGGSAFATWHLDDFTVACDACREKSNAEGRRCRAEREMPYAPALRALLAHPAWIALTNVDGQ